MELFISIARGNGKSSHIMDDELLYLWSKGKKKKAFLKWLMGVGVPRDNISKYSKWIAKQQGAYGYNWYTFKWFSILTGPIAFREEDIDEIYKHEYFW